MSYKGYFKPKNPKKYLGNPSMIIYRSLWELKYMSHLDTDFNVLQWGSEEVAIPYKSPVDNSWHRYYPDFLVIKNTKNGLVTAILEIKPKSQTIEPKMKTKKPTKSFINEVFTYGINEAKWKAAEIFCKERNWVFGVLTEYDIGIKNDKNR